MTKGLQQLEILRRNYCVLKREREYACDTIEQELKEGETHKNASEILRIIFNAPFIIEVLNKRGELGKRASHRYSFGTIAEEDVEKVKEFFKDVKIY